MNIPEKTLAFRILIYYLLTFAGLILLTRVFPQTGELLASGGSAGAGGAAQLQQALESGAATGGGEAIGFLNQRALVLLAALVGTVIFSVPLAWTYSLSSIQSKQHGSIRETIILLPITVASVVVIVENSIALAFSLIGIVTAVRFRSNIKTPADAVFVFAALAIGLAAGVSEIGVAGVGSMFFCFTYIGLRITGVVHPHEMPEEEIVDASGRRDGETSLDQAEGTPAADDGVSAAVDLSGQPARK